MRFLVCVALALAAIPTAAEDWPGFRGPTRQGISTETTVPLKWSATEGVAWKTPIPGEGFSSPIVVGGRVFLTTATEGGASFRLLALEADTGRVVWDNEIFRQEAGHRQPRNSYATPTPVSDGRHVYVVAFDGSISAVALDGKKVWEYREVKFYSEHGLAVSPILHNGLLIVPFDGSSSGPDKAVGWQKPWDQSFLLALDARTGAVRWKGTRGLSRIAHVTPGIISVDGKDQLVSGAGDVVQGFDPETGERLWSVTYPGEGVVPSVVIGDGVVFTASGFGATSICATQPGTKTAPAKTLWKTPHNAPTMCSFLYRKPYLFTANEKGVAQCLKAETGEVVWEQRLGGEFSVSPVYAAGRVYFLSASGECFVVDAGPEYRELARSALGERCQASPAISGGRFFIRTASNLYCIR